MLVYYNSRPLNSHDVTLILMLSRHLSRSLVKMVIICEYSPLLDCATTKRSAYRRCCHYRLRVQIVLVADGCIVVALRGTPRPPIRVGNH